MLLFTAVMLTDVFLLDFYNTVVLDQIMED